MKGDMRTTIFGWVAAIALTLGSVDTPIAPKVPEPVKQISQLVGLVCVGLLGHNSADKKGGGQ